MGRIAGLTTRIQPNKTPIALEMERFMKIVGLWAGFLGLVCGTAALSLGYNWIDSAIFLIAIIVANVPEGNLQNKFITLLGVFQN